MNVAMTQTQNQLASQDAAPSAAQRRHIDKHAANGVAALRAAGVTDELWLLAVEQHLADRTGSGDDALVFTGDDGGRLSPHRFRWQMRRAAAAAGRPDLTFHKLRHTGATLAAATGATTADLMSRLGHATPTMAMRYQHTAADRDRLLAAALSTVAGGQRAHDPETHNA